MFTLQEINISHLGKRKIIFKYAISGGYVNSLEWRVSLRWHLAGCQDAVLHQGWFTACPKLKLPKTNDNKTSGKPWCLGDYWIWLVVSTLLKHISQDGNLPQLGVKNEKKLWNHHLGIYWGSFPWLFWGGGQFSNFFLGGKEWSDSHNFSPLHRGNQQGLATEFKRKKIKPREILGSSHIP